MAVTQRSENAFTIVSSDGHAVGPMEEYRPYLESKYQAEFDEWLPVWKELGAYSISEEALRFRVDDSVLEEWMEEIVGNGRTEGFRDPSKRIEEMDAHGIAAEVLFPDFGTPFTLGGPARIVALGLKPARRDQVDAGCRAHNRWIADFIKVAPERFAPMAALTFDDIPRALEEVSWACDAGFRGILLPSVPDDAQLFDPRYDPIWDALEDHQMVANSHVSLSADLPMYGPQPHPVQALALFGTDAFISVQRILRLMIWGGVLERHPRLKLVFTEQQSDWVVPLLAKMDFSYRGSDLRKEIRDLVPRAPSEYWERQCYLGSSIFSRAEIASRHSIGLEKMMLGFDYPHFEGAWRLGVAEYMRATLGAERVPEEEARMLAGESAIECFGLDGSALHAIAQRIGYSAVDILEEPAEPLKGVSADLNRPLVSVGAPRGVDDTAFPGLRASRASARSDSRTARGIPPARHRGATE